MDAPIPSSEFSTSLNLLQRVRAQDEQAWQRLTQIYTPLVTSWGRKTGLSGTDLDDVIQDVFLAVFRSLDTFRKDQPGTSFRAWLLTITTNKIRDLFRQRQQQAVPVDPQNWELAVAQLETDEQTPRPNAKWELVHQVLPIIRQDFADHVWQAFWRTTVDGQSAPDVGAELNMRQDAVRQAKARVLRRLRLELADLV